MTVFNKLYFPVDALAKHEDFDIWYEDGELCMHVAGDWKTEHDVVRFYGRLGGESGRIKPDYKSLSYQIKFERYDYELQTFLLNRHYYVKGMLWDAKGTLANKSLKFISERDNKTGVRVERVKFADKGECFQIRVKNLSTLRIAAASVVAIALKEEWRGLSMGERDENAPWYKKIIQFFREKGLSAEEVEAGKTHVS